MIVMRQTPGGLMAARLTLTAPDTATFTLIAMHHVAEQGFYDTARSDLAAHDAVLCEGGGRAGGLIAWIHGLAAGGDLTTQAKALSWNGEAHWYNADMDRTELLRRLRAVGWLRLAAAVGVLIPGALLLRIGWIRRWIDAGRSDIEEDLSALESVFGSSLHKLVVADRDAILASHCAAMMDGWAGCRIAVPWGAGHIPQLAEFLVQQHGYEISDIRWWRVSD